MLPFFRFIHIFFLVNFLSKLCALLYFIYIHLCGLYNTYTPRNGNRCCCCCRSLCFFLSFLSCCCCYLKCLVCMPFYFEQGRPVWTAYPNICEYMKRINRKWYLKWYWTIREHKYCFFFVSFFVARSNELFQTHLKFLQYSFRSYGQTNFLNIIFMLNDSNTRIIHHFQPLNCFEHKLVHIHQYLLYSFIMMILMQWRKEAKNFQQIY